MAESAVYLKSLGKTQRQIKATSSDERALAVHACWGVPRRCIQGKTLYIFEQFGVDVKLSVEVLMS